MPANGRSCGKCDYWEKNTTCCRLSPGSRVTPPDYWCGQYKPNAEKKVAKQGNKLVFGDFNNVKLTPEEHSKLMQKYPDYLDRIEKLSRYIAQTGRKYSSHYATLLTWAEKDAPAQQQGPVY